MTTPSTGWEGLVIDAPSGYSYRVREVGVPENFAREVIGEPYEFRKDYTPSHINLISTDNALVLLDARTSRKGDEYLMYIICYPTNEQIGRPLQYRNKEVKVEGKLSLKQVTIPTASDKIYDEAKRKKSKWNKAMYHIYDTTYGEEPPIDNFREDFVDDISDYSRKEILDSVAFNPLTLDLLVRLNEVHRDAAVDIHTFICCGFRLISIGVLVDANEPVKQNAKSKNDVFTPRQPSYLDIHPSYKNTVCARLVYTFQTPPIMRRLIARMKQHSLINHVVRSRILTKGFIPSERIFDTFIYPKTAVYAVISTCDLAYCSGVFSLFGESSEKPRKYPNTPTKIKPRTIRKQPDANTVNKNVSVQPTVLQTKTTHTKPIKRRSESNTASETPDTKRNRKDRL